MKPRRFAAANKVFRLDGGNEDHDLWVQQTTVEDEILGPVPAIISRWQLTPDELQTLVEGGRVEVCVIGDAQPPISLAVAPPE